MFDLFKTFFQIGLFTFGGGYAMIPLIEQKVVDEKHWVGHEELVDLIAVAQSCPGVFAVNISIFIGYKQKGVWGAFLSTLGACLPSFIIILLIAFAFTQFRDNPWVEKFFKGLRPAVVGLLAAATLLLCTRENFSTPKEDLWQFCISCFLFAAAFYGVKVIKINPIHMILYNAVAGLILLY